MTNVGLTPESMELDDLIDENLKCPKEELDHEWLKQSDNFYASHKKSTKIIKTAAAILGCSSVGIYAEIVGPTIPDLKDRVDANYEEIARVLVARSVGYCLGAVIGGILAHRNPTHLELFIFLSCLFGTVGSAVVPWCKDLWMLALMLHIEGWGQAFINTGTDTMILAMWGKDAASPVHALHFGFGMGAVLAPLLARPFIAERNLVGLNGGEISPNNSTGLYEASSLSLSSSPSFSSVSSPPLATTPLPGLESDIQIPYSISALYSFIFCLLFLGFYLKDYYRRKAFKIQKDSAERQRANLSSFSSTKDFLKSFSPGSCTSGNVTFGLMIFTLIFLYYGNVVGGERAYGRFIFSYAIKSEQGFSSSDAAMLNSIFWIGFTSGRGLSSVLAYWCPVYILIIVDMTANVISGVALTIWGSSVPAVLWVFTGVLGLFLSPIFPSGLAWSNMYVEMKGLAVTVVYIGASVGAIVYQWVTGYLFEYEGPATLMYVILGYALFISLTFILMVIVVRPHGKRFDRQH